jgi:hypothetical protein
MGSSKENPMSEAIKGAIAELQNQIQNWEREIAETKRVCNTLAQRAGLPPIYADADLQAKASVTTMRRDQFYGKTLTAGMKEYLQMRGAANLGPATVNDIFDGLAQGGFDHGSANDDNAKRVIRITLTKNSYLFHRLPDDKHFGLTEWYPNVKVKKTKDDEGDDGDKDTEPSQPSLDGLEVKPKESKAAKPATA